MSPTDRFAHRMARLKPSAVREILAAAERPDVISLAGGLPAPELFPSQEIADAYARVLRDTPGRALQYGATEGCGPLREHIAARLARRGVRATADTLLVTSGSQQGLDLVARVLLDPGDVVLVESPTYLAALQAFSAYEVDLVSVGSDHDGLQVEALDEALRRCPRPPKLLYVVADFQNPKGTSLSAARRAALYRFAEEHGVTILEDDPYGELRFRGEALPAIASYDTAGRVVRLGTFSKTLAPGLRIGWIHAEPRLRRALVLAKQAADLHTATLAQWAVADLLDRLDLDAHLQRLREVYWARMAAMVAALQRHAPPGTRWTTPDGGLFLWLTLPPGAQDDALALAALEAGVAVVPGCGFFAGEPSHECVRLNFSHPTEARIAEGVARLCDVIRRSAR